MYNKSFVSENNEEKLFNHENESFTLAQNAFCCTTLLFMIRLDLEILPAFRFTLLRR